MKIPSKWTISTSPFLHARVDTPGIMYEVIVTLVPVIGVAIWYFGISALLIVLASSAGCLMAEYLYGPAGSRGRSLRDGSALLTGILLALTLPPGFPLWMAFVGGFIGIALGKMMWGGLGQNVFNPALLGRAFLQAAFPIAITTWEAPEGPVMAFRGATLAPPFMQASVVDGYSGATPLAGMKFENETTEIGRLLLGNTSGSLGETCGLLLLLLGVYLVIRRIISWRIPLAILLTTGLFSGLLYLIDPQEFASPLFMIFAGGLMIATVYMATDPATSPLTPRGCWIFGFGIGFLVILIRVWGGLPEGVMYAVLLMNAATPLIDRFVKTRVYGH